MSNLVYIDPPIFIYIAYQIEPGSQTEQAPPSAVLHLGPEEMHGFRFLTISVAPRPVLLPLVLHVLYKHNQEPIRSFYFD